MFKLIKDFKLNPNCHCTSKYLNNLVEQDHHHIKVRKTGYQSVNRTVDLFRTTVLFTL